MPQCRFCGGEIDARGLKSHELWCDDRPDGLEDVQEDVDGDHADVRKDAGDELDEDVQEDVDEDTEEFDADPTPEQRDVAADGDGGEWKPEPATADGGTDTRDSGTDSGTDTRDSGMDSGTDSGTDSPDGSAEADDGDEDYWCGNCEAALEYLQKPCPNCGETPAWSQLV